jgi:hypothetical protein
MAGPRVLPIARQLREHLVTNNLAAMESFADLKNAAGGAFAEPLRQIEKSLDRLDFADARRHLDAIEAELAS